MYMLRSEPGVTATPETQQQQSITIIRQLRRTRQLIEIRKEERMKKQYDAPKTEVILLEEEDIILTSSSGGESRGAARRAVVDENPEGTGVLF
jgi:hypothetical protein